MSAPDFPRFRMQPYWIWLPVILAPTVVPWVAGQLATWRLAADGCIANFKMGSGCSADLDGIVTWSFLIMAVTIWITLPGLVIWFVVLIRDHSDWASDRTRYDSEESAP
jgi:hypothetical protein